MVGPKPDHYGVLGLPFRATKGEITKAYHKLARKHHPDKGGDPTKFKEANESYDVLKDDAQRSTYKSAWQDWYDTREKEVAAQEAARKEAEDVASAAKEAAGKVWYLAVWQAKYPVSYSVEGYCLSRSSLEHIQERFKYWEEESRKEEAAARAEAQRLAAAAKAAEERERCLADFRAKYPTAYSIEGSRLDRSSLQYIQARLKCLGEERQRCLADFEAKYPTAYLIEGSRLGRSSLQQIQERFKYLEKEEEEEEKEELRERESMAEEEAGKIRRAEQDKSERYRILKWRCGIFGWLAAVIVIFLFLERHGANAHVAISNVFALFSSALVPTTSLPAKSPLCSLQKMKNDEESAKADAKKKEDLAKDRRRMSAKVEEEKVAKANAKTRAEAQDRKNDEESAKADAKKKEDSAKDRRRRSAKVEEEKVAIAYAKTKAEAQKRRSDEESAKADAKKKEDEAQKKKFAEEFGKVEAKTDKYIEKAAATAMFSYVVAAMVLGGLAGN